MEEFEVPNDLRITNIALGAELADESGRTSVKLTYEPPKPSHDSDDEEAEEDEDEDDDDEPVTTVLCSLTPSKVCIIAHLCTAIQTNLLVRLSKLLLTSFSRRTSTSFSRLLAKSAISTIHHVRACSRFVRIDSTVYLTGNYIGTCARAYSRLILSNSCTDQLPPPGAGDEDDYDRYGLGEIDSDEESDELEDDEEEGDAA